MTPNENGSVPSSTMPRGDLLGRHVMPGGDETRHLTLAAERRAAVIFMRSDTHFAACCWTANILYSWHADAGEWSLAASWQAHRHNPSRRSQQFPKSTARVCLPFHLHALAVARSATGYICARATEHA